MPGCPAGALSAGDTVVMFPHPPCGPDRYSYIIFTNLYLSARQCLLFVTIRTFHCFTN
jgi:hypothetical protein